MKTQDVLFAVHGILVRVSRSWPVQKAASAVSFGAAVGGRVLSRHDRVISGDGPVTPAAAAGHGSGQPGQRRQQGQQWSARIAGSAVAGRARVGCGGWTEKAPTLYDYAWQGCVQAGVAGCGCGCGCGKAMYEAVPGLYLRLPSWSHGPVICRMDRSPARRL